MKKHFCKIKRTLGLRWWAFWWKRRMNKILRTETTEQIITRLKRAGLYMEADDE